MDNQIVQFIRGLRAAGVRVSLAESVDGMNAVAALGIADKDTFREALRATLVKDSNDFAPFNELFPLYFSSDGPVMEDGTADLTPDEQKLLEMALSAMSGRMQRLMEWLSSGDGPTKEELEELARQSGANWAENPGQAQWVTRRMLQKMGFARLEEQMRALREMLQAMGMSEEAIANLMGVMETNKEALAEQTARRIGKQIAEQRANRRGDLYGSDLMHKSFGSLTEKEADALRKEVQRLVTQLRSRAAMRRKRGLRGSFDAKGTIRANQQYGGVPVELRYRRKKMKPSLVLICDVSTSMRPVAEFMLRLVYELQDQAAKTRSFAFNSDMQEISVTLSGSRAAEAVTAVLYDIPPGYYATDLGHSLDTFFHDWLDAVNGRTTVVIVGDGRNNYNSPRLDLVKTLQRRAKRLVWLNPEREAQWGTGDSDMREYAPLCDEVFTVRNLAQLGTAVDKILAG